MTLPDNWNDLAYVRACAEHEAGRAMLCMLPPYYGNEDTAVYFAREAWRWARRVQELEQLKSN